MSHYLPSLSGLHRGHTPSNPRSHRHAARGAGPRSRELDFVGSWFAFSIGRLPSSFILLVSRILSRSSTDRGNTRSVSRAQLAPLRFYWSTKTRPVPPLWFYPSLLRMTSFRVSPRQRQHLPLSSPLSPPRSAAIPYTSPLVVLSVLSCHHCNN